VSITNSMYIGVSGLDAHGDAISVIGDNIANASTIGFKAERAEFSDMLGGQLASQRLGGGVRLAGTDTLFNQGAITQTGQPLDMAISGNGFFTVAGTHDGQNGQFYTRDGSFHMDNKGYVVDSNGMRLQGYTIDAKGQKSTAVGDLPIGARSSPPVATTSAATTGNLDADAAPPAVTPFDPANPTATSNFATSETVTDSLGKQHQVQLYYVKTAAGQWDYHAMVDGGDLAGGTAGTPQQVAGGTLAFDTSGNFTAQTPTGGSVNFAGAAPGQAIDFDMKGMTQTANTSAVTGTTVDGRQAGSLTDVVVNSDGTVQGVYDNGDKIDIAQVGLADFANQQGLQRQGDNLYAATDASGQATIDAAGSGGRGSITAGALESSNVDLGNELVTLIAYQRAYEANSKTVTTADEMMQDVTNLKR
jgi:flagellar hook protein FlgE